ncbi:MAG: hypothetical protein ACL93V_16475 [Candidatus Electrothrix sp. YB6]
MTANIFLRSIFFLLLTAGVQHIGLKSHDLPDSKIIFCYVLPTVLFLLACWQWRKIGAFKRRAWMAENPAKFNPDLIDCYVRFTGKVTEERPCRLPLSGSECVYYAALVVGERQVKKKKPSKGWETVRKPLLREQSSATLELADKDCRVHVKVEEFTKRCLGLRSKESTQVHCPTALKSNADRKYKLYHLTEYFLFHGDSVTVQGRLSCGRDGRLFIKPTRRFEFPSFIAVQHEADQFISDAWDAAWSKRINVAFLLLNAGLLIYFWW